MSKKKTFVTLGILIVVVAVVYIGLALFVPMPGNMLFGAAKSPSVCTGLPVCGHVVHGAGQTCGSGGTPRDCCTPGGVQGTEFASCAPGLRCDIATSTCK